MFCCCGDDPSAHPVEDSNRKSERTTAKPVAQTVKNNASAPSQTQSVATSNKTSVSANSNQEHPVTVQPKTAAKSVSPASHTQSQKAPVKPNSNPQPVDISDIQTKLKDTDLQSNPVVSSAKPTSSEVAITAKPHLSNMPNIEQLKSINSELEKLDKAIGEAEAKPNWEAKSSVPKLANQLKALTSQVLSTAAGPGTMAEQAILAAVCRLETVTARLEALATSAGSGGHTAAGDSGAVSPFVLAYDEIISGPLAKFISLSNDIGGDVKTQAALVKQAIDAQRSFLVVASKSRQPDQSTFVELLKDSATKLQAVQDFRENNRKSENFNHLSAISESIAALGWVTISPAPGPYVKEMSDAGTFYTNRVLKDYKEKDPKHVEWCRSWLATLTELQAYIKQHHTTGLTWNPQGVDPKTVKTTASPPVAAAGGAPPPPPPGPPPPPLDTSSNSKDGESAGRSALFAEINKGDDVTKGLKKVTDDMKTHKNPTLRQGPAPFKAAPAAKLNTSSKPAAKAPPAASHPPLTELQGKKWVIEYHKNNKNLVLDNVDLKQAVYIYKCDDCVIKVQGKVNSIVVDSCKKTGIVFDDLVSSLEFVNCQSMQAQVTGKIPTLSIDKTDGCMMYLSPDSLNVEIVTAKSSEMNILVPCGNGDFKEFALPEQFKTTYDGKTMVTVATDIV